MKTIGITGGVGAGKSEIIGYLETNLNCVVIKADNLAYELESPGHVCYQPIIDLLGPDILDEDGFINKGKMAGKIFADKELLGKVNSIIHPAVKEYILNAIDLEKKKGQVDYFFLEAALLIEEGYDKILDELWYVRVDADVRRIRLRETRGYSDEKIDSILAAQRSDEEFKKYCRFTIDNSKDLDFCFRQIDNYLGR